VHLQARVAIRLNPDFFGLQVIGTTTPLHVDSSITTGRDAAIASIADFHDANLVGPVDVQLAGLAQHDELVYRAIEKLRFIYTRDDEPVQGAIDERAFSHEIQAAFLRDVVDVAKLDVFTRCVTQGEEWAQFLNLHHPHPPRVAA
jgi:hypothetical protein